MKRLSVILLSATLLSSNAFGDSVLATFKGGEIKESQLMEQFKNILAMQQDSKNKKFSDLPYDLQDTLIRALLNLKLLEAEVAKSDIASSKEFQEKLNLVKKQMVQQEFIESYAKSHLTEKMIDEEYQNMLNNLKGKDEVKVSHILVEEEKLAIETHKKLKKGASFDKLAKEYSKDEGSKLLGGDIGYVREGQLVPEFEKQAFAMKVNEISPPVKTQFGWHIITVTSRKPITLPKKEEVIQEITNKLSKKIIEEYFADLVKKADAKILITKKVEIEKPVDKPVDKKNN